MSFMISHKKIVVLFFFCLFYNAVKAQTRESNTWYFGFNAGLNFNVIPPQPLTNGALSSQEGCASICNKRGELLFYTNGVTVYTKNHTAMPNGTGLFGDNSSTQSAIIIPNPGDTNLFYIFTADCSENSFVKGYNFSVVDMRLNGRLGDVTSQKNVNLYSPSTERLTAVKAANGIDYWVITKGFDNNRFTAYKVDCNGINLTPVISDVGTRHINDPSFFSGTGQLKASPDGKKICVAITGPPTAMAQLFDFDNNTGVLSNPIDLTGYVPGYVYIYGIEFSPNSKLLYVSTALGQTIHQYDITSGNQATINASKFILSTGALYPVGLQIAPDRKIYVASNLQPAISVINNPDIYGAGCNLSLGSVNLGGKFCGTSLPSYISSFFDSSKHIDFTSSFINCHTQFNGTTNRAGNLTWDWDFGDGSFGSGQNVDHAYRQVGTYNVTLKVSSTAACNLTATDTVSHTITINNVLAVDYYHNAGCVNEAVQFNDSTVLSVGNIISRTWDFDDGSPTTNALNPVHTFTNPGVYNVKLLVSTTGVCNADSMIKQIYIDTRPTTVFTPVDGCMNVPLQFNDNSVNTTGGVGFWKWYFGDGDSSVLKDPMHSYTNYGNYDVQLQVTSAHGCAATPVSKPVVIGSNPVVVFDFQYPCLDKITLFSNSSSNSFGNIISNTWNFGDNSGSALVSPTHQYTAAGIYNVSLTVATQNGCSTTLVKPIDITLPAANAGPDASITANQPYQMQGSGSGTGTYLWSPATGLSDATIANPVARLSNDQQFTLTTTTAGGCVATDDVFIKIVADLDVYVPSAFTPNDDRHNDILIPYPVGIRQLNYFRIYNRYGQLVYSTTQQGVGWDGKIKGKLQPVGTYVWELQAINTLGRTIKKSGTTVLLQ
jgi:gliding motility-associated-like protein